MKTLNSILLTAALVALQSTAQAQSVSLGNATPPNQAEIMQGVLGAYVKGSTTYQDTAWPLFVNAAAAGLCQDTVYRTGFSPRVVDAKMEEAYIGSTGILPGVTVHYVVPNSPAAQAGLKENDQVASVNGRPAPASGKNISKKFSEMFEEAVANAGKTGGAVELEVNQAGQIKRISLTPVKTCNLSISALADAGRFMEQPDPTQVLVSQAVMEQAADETERQIVIAYAMAKNLSGAVAAKRNVNRFASALNTAMLFAPLALPVDPTVMGLGTVLGGGIEPVGHVAANLFAATKSGKADEISLAILKASGINAIQVLAFWEKYLASDSNSMVLKWVNGSAMTKARLDVIRKAANTEQSESNEH